ncbi:MAG: M28 family peptidase, partial [Ignavibacteriae bacterium]|nr:M28 family peptidase [Ignavibacteriota bacterium]
ITIVSIALSSCTHRQYERTSPSTPDITAQELQHHVKYLTSDELQGRRAGEKGNEVAAAYIASEFKKYGLLPVGDKGTYLQHFNFISSVKVGEQNKFAITANGKSDTLTLQEEFRPMGFSLDTTITAQLVFCGYGISDTALNYDDYANIDVTNKIIIVLRYTPEGRKQESPFFKHAPFRAKAFQARTQGAAGAIFLSGPLDEDSIPRLIPFTFERGFGHSGIAAVTMKWTTVDSIFKLVGKDLKAIQQEMNSTKQPQSFKLPGVIVSLQTQVFKVTSTTANILGYSEGVDPVLKNEVLVIGAHMDHLGMGGDGSLKPDTVAIHYGADDNASGTAALLEVAQYVSSQRYSLKRSILFIAFSGEELGLLGSDYYVKNPAFPLERTIAMMNMDMIGRLRESTLVVEGMGTSPRWRDIVQRQNADSFFTLKLKDDGFGPSDHASFYAKDIPVMFFFTNLHSDYHRPSDTREKINYDGEQHIVEFVARIVTDIANSTEKPAFTKVASAGPGMSSDRENIRVSLGVMPDYAEETVGLKISGTRAGSAAEKAGLQGGDIIIKLDGKDIKNIYDFMYLLGNYKPGDEVVVVIKRGNEELSLHATLEARR